MFMSKNLSVEFELESADKHGHQVALRAGMVSLFRRVLEVEITDSGVIKCAVCHRKRLCTLSMFLVAYTIQA